MRNNVVIRVWVGNGRTGVSWAFLEAVGFFRSGVVFFFAKLYKIMRKSEIRVVGANFIS